MGIPESSSPIAADINIDSAMRPVTSSASSVRMIQSVFSLDARVSIGHQPQNREGHWALRAARAAHLVVNGIDPRRILLLTFTRRAAEEMIVFLVRREEAGQSA